VHPTSTNEVDAYSPGSGAYLTELEKLVEEDRGEGGSKRIISIGEVGLGRRSPFIDSEGSCQADYDRLQYSSIETQLKNLPSLLRFSRTFHLPLFLHSRTSNAHRDLVRTLRDVAWGGMGDGWPGGVVHSFTGTMEEMKELVRVPDFVKLGSQTVGRTGIVHRHQRMFAQNEGELGSGQSGPS